MGAGSGKELDDDALEAAWLAHDNACGGEHWKKKERMAEAIRAYLRVARPAPDYAGHSGAHTYGGASSDPIYDAHVKDVLAATREEIYASLREWRRKERIRDAAPDMLAALRLVADSGKFQCFDDTAWDVINDALARAEDSQ